MPPPKEGLACPVLPCPALTGLRDEGMHPTGPSSAATMSLIVARLSVVRLRIGPSAVDRGPALRCLPRADAHAHAT
ncbi:hypothetical protein COCVIDRAFT_93915 [Bipolaris victoriae FI3]|uniref:Uncharacterized protein n=1 Tax=Bipolaris victoriae (strain FI3) TaxID=930091 RepID=W7EQ02_BIPV3|nr:hypothetical protein COCVIDRAFT_93915 [Bipolaris victoriae FI3]